jgi:hypothetical protein
MKEVEVTAQFYKFTCGDAPFSIPHTTTLDREAPIPAVNRWVVDEKA